MSDCVCGHADNLHHSPGGGWAGYGDMCNVMGCNCTDFAIKPDEPVVRICKHCFAANCKVHCPGNTNGVHNGDPHSIKSIVSLDFIVNIKCRFCNKYGIAKISPDDINWSK